MHPTFFSYPSTGSPAGAEPERALPSQLTVWQPRHVRGTARPSIRWPVAGGRLLKASGGRRGQRRSRSQGDHPTAIWGPSPELSHDTSAYPTGHTTTVTQGMLGNIFSPENWSTWAIWCASDAPRESSSMCGAHLLLHGSCAQAPAKAPSCSPGQGSCLGDGEGSQGDPQPREEGEHVPLPPARWAQVSRPGEPREMVDPGPRPSGSPPALPGARSPEASATCGFRSEISCSSRRRLSEPVSPHRPPGFPRLAHRHLHADVWRTCPPSVSPSPPKPPRRPVHHTSPHSPCGSDGSPRTSRRPRGPSPDIRPTKFKHEEEVNV
ncbi:uncharacterized protein LOC113596835 isoform X2 [Acinonyx jubatus]|uniref:Uncharacterized protein LOC113596835 isoform X2 n=1 Tax=Acinonyx jubatus TaxID=32536 RepID=A0ABM3NLX1_ACIJB|nr:uncharacterized protein LOC113596835 isoform X2 [Acinonyx jubatus]